MNDLNGRLAKTMNLCREIAGRVNGVKIMLGGPTGLTAGKLTAGKQRELTIFDKLEKCENELSNALQDLIRIEKVLVGDRPSPALSDELREDEF